MVTPKTKQEFHSRWRAMEFGNRVRIWDTQTELMSSGFRGTVTARSKEAGGSCIYRVNALEAAISQAYAGMTFNESAPDEFLTMQGEFTHDTLKGYALYCSTEPLPMRQALVSSGVQYYGL